MIIKKISIKKFRGFKDLNFEPGKHLTAIAGQNGTQKTTVLGMLSQPFAITLKENPMLGEKPLCGGNFKSGFSDKFKFSDVFDKVGEHEWTIHQEGGDPPYTVESIKRVGKKEKETIRFWKQGDRTAGSGYIQLPVIYLSLKRLLPIGEDKDITKDNSVILSDDKFDFYKKWYNKILINLDDILESNYIASGQKNTLGANTSSYDWKLNSAGQDNIGKIILAILSFKRLKEKYQGNYNGGILAIDELDATLYPASQLKLIDALRNFSSKYNIQIIFTSHSLTILEKLCELQENTKIAGQNKVVYLEKKDDKIVVTQNVSFSSIKNRLKVIIENKKTLKIDVFTEDAEAIIFTKSILKRKATNLNFIKCKLGCSELIELASKKVPSFMFPNSIIILDGDIKNKPSLLKKAKKLNNVITLPTNQSIEQLLAYFLSELSDTSTIWSSINTDFNKQYCFRDYTPYEILHDRDKAKKWFNSHLPVWGKNASKIINPWTKAHPENTNLFINEFTKTYNKFARELQLNEIHI